jgi:hypothetical protein
MITYLKQKFELNQIDIVEYMNRITQLFRYDKSNKKKLIVLPENIKESIPSNLQPNGSIFKISQQSFSYIKNYLNSNRDYLISLVKDLRSRFGICFYNLQHCDAENFSVTNKYDCKIGATLYTTPNGNCLYNAISLALYGNEIKFSDIKLGMIFILFEYEAYFRNLVTRFDPEVFETQVENSASLGVFGNSFNIISLSLLFLRPIRCYSFLGKSRVADVSKLNGYPIFLSLRHLHFTPIVPVEQFFINDVEGDHLHFIKFSCGDLKYY